MRRNRQSICCPSFAWLHRSCDPRQRVERTLQPYWCMLVLMSVSRAPYLAGPPSEEMAHLMTDPERVIHRNRRGLPNISDAELPEGPGKV